MDMSGADAGVIPSDALVERANSPVNICKRWAHQSALLNGTVYIYGGEAKTSSDQTDNTWNNNFLTLDLTKSWSVSSPTMKGLSMPSGPPAVALGYLWNDYENLYLYGGEFADNPYVEPSPMSTWKYSIPSSSWTEYTDPVTSQGNFSTNANIPIQRAAEGAGISVPELGLSWYFGGHLDLSTTPGWSNQIPRIYLKSLLEFTHPGYANTGVFSLRDSGAGDGGVYRNITQGGIQDASGFSERADGVLVFVPGWGQRGILLGLGGGTVNQTTEADDSFTSMQTIDVYDIESSTWYHQQVSGPAPEVRVNPCAVIFSAPDASSFNIYMYGGQNLLPVGTQMQYTDVWILSIPAFTWIKVSPGGNEPHARAGHMCHARDGQMVVIGGYIGDDVPCESPGVFNFDASSLQWETSFQAAQHPPDLNPGNNVLAGSYGYRVPQPVQDVIGGSSDGGATMTTPAVGQPSKGPFATGQPPIFTITDPGSTATATVTNWGPTRTGSDSGGGGATPEKPNSSKTSGGLIAAGVIAGLTGLLACYLGFCAILYRRQVNAYKRHMAVANRYSGATAPGAHDEASGGVAAAGLREKLRKHRPTYSSSDEDEYFSWVGQLGEPKWASGNEDHSPGSGSGSGSGLANSSRARPSEERTQRQWGYLDGPSSNLASAGGGLGRMKSSATRSTASGSSTEQLLANGEPSFFSVVMKPRRALRVVNLEERTSFDG